VGVVAEAKVVPRKEVVAEAETWGDVAQVEAQEVVLEAWEPREAEAEVRKGVPLTVVYASLKLNVGKSETLLERMQLTIYELALA
jgi:hypothetical protein